MRKFAQNHHFYIFLAVLLVLNSCVKEMDFDGVKDIVLEPEMEINLMKALITTEEIVAKIDEEVEGKDLPDDVLDVIYEGGTTINPEPSSVDITSEERIIKYLDSAALDFRIINTTPRNMSIKLILEDEAGGEIDSFEQNVNATAEGADPVTVTMLFEGDKVDELKKLTQVEVNIVVYKGEDLRLPENNTGRFELTSSGIFKFNYDISNGLP